MAALLCFELQPRSPKANQSISGCEPLPCAKRGPKHLQKAGNIKNKTTERIEP